MINMIEAMHYLFSLFSSDVDKISCFLKILIEFSGIKVIFLCSGIHFLVIVR